MTDRHGYAFIDPAEEPGYYGIDPESPEYGEAYRRYLESLTDDSEQEQARPE